MNHENNFHTRSTARLGLALSVLALAVLSACAPMPKLAEPAPLLRADAVGLSADARTASDLSAEWWTAYQDPQLDALMRQALAQHPSIAAARARLARAGAGVESAEAAERPTVGAGADVTRIRYTEHGLYPSPLAGNTYTNGTLAVQAEYDFDFFGRHKAALEAALGNQRAAQADEAAARLNLSSNIARAYLALARTLAVKEVLEQQAQRNGRTLALVRERVQAGLEAQPAQRSAETPLPELRRQLEVLDAQAQLLRHQLAALSAQPMDALQNLAPKLPQPLALDAQRQLGSDLLGRRPELVAARWRVEAATQNVAEARAQFYPNISLGAMAGFNAIDIDNLLKASSRQLSFGPSVRLPLFDTGRLRAQLRGNAAELDAAVASYNGALLDALRDARDQLSTVQSLQRQQQAQAEAQQTVEAGLALARQRYEAGLSNYLSVINAEQALLAQQRQRIELQGQGLEAQVALMRSLGGGWTDAQP